MLVQAYQAEWPATFDVLKKHLLDALGSLPVIIEHVGSTAVPDLAAKPIIDIDVVFAQASLFDDIKAKLERIGYYHNGNQGVIDREVFKREKRLFKHPIFDKIPHHLYVCSSHSEELKRHLLLRDYLRKNTIARRQYEHLKYQLAEETNHNKKKYAELKETQARPFIEACLQKAQEAASSN